MKHTKGHLWCERCAMELAAKAAGKRPSRKPAKRRGKPC